MRRKEKGGLTYRKYKITVMGPRSSYTTTLESNHQFNPQAGFHTFISKDGGKLITPIKYTIIETL